jgi:hypothetical protein
LRTGILTILTPRIMLFSCRAFLWQHSAGRQEAQSGSQCYINGWYSY